MSNETDKRLTRKTELARNLRKKATPAERKLWAVLRNRQLGGFKFYRQFPIEPYIVDFCCRSKRLIIEIDGGVHVGRENDDQKRARYLEEKGYTIIRFNNNHVIYDINQVVEAIMNAIQIK